MCCKAGRRRCSARCTSELADEGRAHSDCRRRSFSKPHAAYETRIPGSGKNHTAAPIPAAHSLRTKRCSGLQTDRSGLRSAVHIPRSPRPTHVVLPAPHRPRRKRSCNIRTGGQKRLPKINLRALRIRQSLERALRWNVRTDNPLNWQTAESRRCRRRFFLRTGILGIFVAAALLGHSGLHQQTESQTQPNPSTRATGAIAASG